LGERRPVDLLDADSRGSAKPVETHLRNIFGKLCVASRAEVAGAPGAERV
jgi:hypothetical protein